MKKTISIISMLIFGLLPAWALASGEHAGAHDKRRMEYEHRSDMSADAHEAAARQPGDPAEVDRTITVSMNDTMRFNPEEMAFKAGETVRFVVRNAGKIRHEMVIGSMDELKEHAEMMDKMPGMRHEEPNMISLAPGKSGELIWRFERPGSVDFACLQPGHLEAGMTGEIVVE